MTITVLTTLDVAVKIVNEPAHMLAIYSRILEELPDQEGSRYYDIAKSPTGPDMTVEIDGISYDVTGIILPRPINSDVSEEDMIGIARTSGTSGPQSHIIFTCYSQYSEWGLRMDLLQVEDDDEGTLAGFLDISIDDKRRLLGLL